MDQLTLIRQLRRVHRNVLITCAIVAPIAGAIAVNVFFDHPRTGGWIAIVLLGLVALGCAYAFVSGLVQPLEKQTEVKNLCARVKLSLPELAEKFERELQQSSSGDPSGAIRFLPTWLYKSGIYDCELVPYEDIAWIHKKVVKRSVNFVPVGRSVSLVIHVVRQTGARASLHHFDYQAAEANVDALFARVAQAAPWALIGWEPGLENRPAEVIARVQKKREQLSQPAA